MNVQLDHRIYSVTVNHRVICFELGDGRSLCAPLEWFPILSAANPAQRQQFRIADGGLSVAWDELGEHISADFLLARRPTR